MGDDEEWTVYWIDTSVIIDRVMNMKRYQVGKIETHSAKYNEGLSVCIRIPYQIVQFFHIGALVLNCIVLVFSILH